MISVTEALDHLFALVTPLPSEEVPLAEAAGQVLAEDAVARRDQPPFTASAMDGYAVAGDPEIGSTLTVIGEAAAGHRFDGSVGPGQAVRIFTGAPVPEGTTRIVIQEDTSRDGDTITVTGSEPSTHLRPRGGDFAAGARVAAPRRLTPSDIALLAAMNVAQVRVTRRPVVAIMSTGDELVMPGETPGPDQIIVSNAFGLKAMLEAEGADVRLLPIARDSEASLTTAFGLTDGADLVVTIGGASVGDHDLVGPVAETLGLARDFYKIAMRPGKPLMAGRMGDAAMVGLPGNPVSAMVCGHVFLRPMIAGFLGLGSAPVPTRKAVLAEPLGKGSARDHYMRATLDGDRITAFARQDSSLLTILSSSNALLIQPANSPALDAGTQVDCIPL
ncbi:gephyrin-like molybdotransferase Glp [Pseudaestuariivita atlantica]|uniref:Molybdopterin molybdenumtransferase n=1 Tax=Pseudaestuariivita atlantica TaxID=1317121 RepID=A0A0L1JMK2_9RHOB|nr:gephyrin-like molybdotransferase Glp [Pseudaestuariivita atlantica]KNG92979.1 molybdenum cofactor biosynthesis protein MoaA [Pseudaestuariivita atlantica]